MAEAAGYCAELVRAADRDRYVATLFAPAEHRGALHALYGFNSEVARVREVAREPLPGEIRLQWWSEVLRGERDGEAQANPVAAALLASIAQYRLPPDKLIDLVDARRFDLYDEPMATLAELETYASKTSAALFALASQILSGSGTEAAAELAGRAHAIAGLLRALPHHAARRQRNCATSRAGISPRCASACRHCRAKRCRPFCRSRLSGRHSAAWIARM